jgi:hypothetical protein
VLPNDGGRANPAQTWHSALMPTQTFDYAMVVDSLAAAQELIEELEGEPRPRAPKVENALAALRKAQLKMYSSLAEFDSPHGDS